MTDNDEALVPVVEAPADMAKLTVTYNGQQGDLPDLVPYDSTDADIKQMVFESLTGGYIPGIDAVANAQLNDFVVDRFPARDDVPFNRLSLRPKTPFGGMKEHWARVLSPLIGGEIVEVGSHNYDDESWPLIKVHTKDGKMIHIEAGRDAEGNGPGWLSVIPQEG